MSRQPRLSCLWFLAASTALVAQPALSQTSEEPLFLGTLVLQSINDGGASVSNTQAANTAGSRVPVDLEDLPRSLTILPQELFEAQGARTFEEAAAYSPGIVTETFGQDNRYDEFILRGFEAQIGGVLRDGMPTRSVDWAAWRTEPFGLESVNILRGPTSDLYGSNQPGGLINGVTKRPEFSFSGETRGVLTSDNGYEAALDFTGPLTDTLAYRIVALGNTSGTIYDEVDTGRIYIAPSLTFEPNDLTTLTLYGQYQEDDVGDTYVVVPQFGSQLDNANGHFGPGTYTGNPDYNTIESTQSYLGYELDHELSPSLSIMSRARIAEVDWLNQTEFPAAFVNSSYLGGAPVGAPSDIDTAVMSAFNVDQTMTQITADTALIYEFSTGAGEGQLAFGIDYFGLDSNTLFEYGYRGERNLLTGELTNNLAGVVPASLPSERYTDIDQIGVYLSGYSEWASGLIVSGGLRWDTIDYRTSGFLTDPVSGVLAFDNTTNESFLSGNVGLGYHITQDLLLYASHSRGFNLPPNGTLSDGSALDLEGSTAYELGLRYTSADGASSFSAAVFDITKTNAVFDDPSSSNPLVYTQAGEVRSRGIELEGTYDFLNGLSLFGSLTYVDAEVTRDPQFQGNRPARAPEVSAAIFAQYEFAEIDGLAVGVGARHTGSRFSDVANDYSVDAVTLFDASISYRQDNWEVMLAGRNLADREYVGFCGQATFSFNNPVLDNVSGSCVYGAGREVSLTLRTLF